MFKIKIPEAQQTSSLSEKHVSNDVPLNSENNVSDFELANSES